MTHQEAMPERDPIEEYWATYGRQSPFRTPAEPENPWTSGRYAVSAIVWGLIALIVLGVGAGP